MKLLLTALLTGWILNVSAQNGVDTAGLYTTAYKLNTAGKPAEAIPLLEKLIQNNAGTANAYNLLGSIYDNQKQPEKAVPLYIAGIKLDSNSRELHYNLAIAYYKLKNYAAAEKSLARALTIEPGHANSHRMYALTSFHQGKKAACIIAYCNFLLLQPQSPQAEEAYSNIDRIFSGSATIKSAGKKGVYALDQYIATAQAAGKGSTPAAKLEDKLAKLFTLVGKAAARQGSKDFFWTFYADRFYQLTQMGQMDVIAHLVGLKATEKENLQWLEPKQAEVDAIQHWLKKK